MSKLPVLLPNPRQLELTGGLCKLEDHKLIILESSQPQVLFFSASRLKSQLQALAGLTYEVYAGILPQYLDSSIVLQLEADLKLPAQGYQLKIDPARIILKASDTAGIFYACCSLIQLLTYYSPNYHPESDLPLHALPCLEITDWPDYSNRGVMLDISRDKVPTMETIFDLVDLLASLKINQVQLYTEHTFAYQQHPEVWSHASPFTGEEIMQLDAFCRERYIELVPNQNSFGHLEHWLRLPRYRPLAEAPDGFDFPWGHHDGPFSLCPLDSGSLALLVGLYDELLPHFSSRQFNVGCDETFDLGQGRSKIECDRLGAGRVYLDFLLKIYEQVRKRGFRMQFWGDIIMDHPELVPELPDDCIALEWGYEADHPFDGHGEKFAEAGLPLYVCPGTSSWNSIAGRTENCLGNLVNAAQNGMKYGAEGYLITDWGDNGHWQTLPVSYLGFAAGAAYAWCFQANQGLDIRQGLNLYVFQDILGGMGSLAYDLGNIYRSTGIELPNESALFYMLQHPFRDWNESFDGETAIQVFHAILDKIESVCGNTSHMKLLRDDRQLLDDEFNLTAALLKHTCMRGLFLFGSNEYSGVELLKELKGIIKEYRRIWLMRNRPGDLHHSLSYFKFAEGDYQNKISPK